VVFFPSIVASFTGRIEGDLVRCLEPIIHINAEWFCFLLLLQLSAKGFTKKKNLIRRQEETKTKTKKKKASKLTLENMNQRFLIQNFWPRNWKHTFSSLPWAYELLAGMFFLTSFRKKVSERAMNNF